MRKLIAGMQSSLDGKIEGPDGYADWVETWSDNYDLIPRVDACLLGARMYPGYEGYWSAVQTQPDKPLPMTNRLPMPAELEWARFAANTPHYVLSSTLTSALWPKTAFLRGLDEIADLKAQPGKDIYLIGGAHMVSTLMDAGLLDEFRLQIHPLVVGTGKPLFATTERRRALELRDVQQLGGGRVSLTYDVA
jgi:dihydrofolate reductase